MKLRKTNFKSVVMKPRKTEGCAREFAWVCGLHQNAHYEFSVEHQTADPWVAGSSLTSGEKCKNC